MVFKKGNIPWNKGKKGIYSNEVIEKMKKGLKLGWGWNKGIKDIHKGKKNPMYGRHHSEEAKEKMRKPKTNTENMKGRKFSLEHRRRIKEHHWTKLGYKHPMLGKHLKPETIEKIRRARAKQVFSEETRKKLSIIRTRLNLGRKLSEKTKNKIGTANKKYWEDPEWVKRMFKARSAKPNKLELKLDELIQKIVPNKFIYTGDGKEGIVIGRKIPDWFNVNGEKKVIELFGRAFHDPSHKHSITKLIPYHSTYEGTMEHYKRYGIECLIIWDDELNNRGEIVEKIRNFVGDISG